ncbi:MAG: histidine kinase [Clostridia bacterium]|nr:histidine kinase [Clostridia bacterium]
MFLVTIVYSLVKGKKTKLLYSAVVCYSLILICILSHASGLVIAPLIGSRDMFLYIKTIMYTLIGVAWVIFCLIYIGQRAYLTARNIALISFVPFVFIVLILTNPYHRLIFTEIAFNYKTSGKLYWLCFFILSAEIVTAVTLLIRYTVKQVGYARRQAMLQVLSVTIPLVIGFIMDSPLTPSGIEITPVSFSISFMLCSIATFKYNFLNIVPIAYKEIVSNMKEAILVIDNYNNISDYNSSFVNMFGKLSSVNKNSKLSDFINDIHGFLDSNLDYQDIINALGDNTAYINREIKLIEPETKYHLLNVQPIMDKKRQVVGRVISFNDITGYKKLLEELNDKNSELSAMNQELIALNEQLKEHSDTVEELAVARERNRIARDAHDTVGHTMTLLISLLELTKGWSANNPVKTSESLNQAISIAKGGLNELRSSISGLVPRNIAKSSITIMLEKMVSEFSFAGVKIDLSVDGILTSNGSGYDELIYRICQEALTNAVRHGKAKHVAIMIRFAYESIKIYIFDDGAGCKTVKKGFGLTGMKQRVRELNGKMIYGSDGEKGFNINIEIPLGVYIK